MDNQSPTQVMHSFTDNKTNTTSAGKAVIILILIALLGIGTGYLLSQNKGAAKLTSMIPGAKNAVPAGKTYGSNDTTTFKDTAEGELKEGGIEGEGQYHLVRPGGDSQNVYLTSSLVDLSLFLNHKIKVWGQTQSAQKAGWLMDVGKVQVLE